MANLCTVFIVSPLSSFASFSPRYNQASAFRGPQNQAVSKRPRRPVKAAFTRCSHASAIPPAPSKRNAPTGSPLHSLETGTWFKLICGASSHDAPSIRNLCAVYTAVGVDCIDVACDLAIVRAARKGIAEGIMRRQSSHSPFLMVSVNAGTDPHFRKASFAPSACPPECRRPCEKVCPADAIDLSGVIIDLCYGCGRCVPVCPPDIIRTLEYQHDPRFVSAVLEDVDAVEIHVGRGQEAEFRELWMQIGDVASRLKVVAVSLPDLGGDAALAAGLQSMWDVMKTHVSDTGNGPRLIWQADGRPMSGDIGRGTAKAAVFLGKRVREALNVARIPGEVQLAGGTNDATVPLMQANGLRRVGYATTSESFGGIAVGGYARKVSCSAP